MKKFVLIMGLEHSCTRLVSKIISHVLNVKKFGQYHGMSKIQNNKHVVYHRSIPCGAKCEFHNPDDIFKGYDDYDKRIILVTRDFNIVDTDRKHSFKNRGIKKLEEQLKTGVKLEKEILKKYQDKAYIFSFETFYILQETYLQRLYKWLGVKSDFMPEVKNVNKKYLSGRKG